MYISLLAIATIIIFTVIHSLSLLLLLIFNDANMDIHACLCTSAMIFTCNLVILIYSEF